MNNSVIFAGNDLSILNGVDIYNFDITQLPNREISIHKLAGRDKSIITSSTYSSKEISVYMDICGGDRETTEIYVAQVKALLQGQNQSLQINYGGKELHYTATMNQFNIEWNSMNAYCEIKFIASDPIGTDIEATTLLNVAGSESQAFYNTIQISGSSKAYPIITVVIKSLTGDATGKTIILQNAGTNQGISITADWVEDDVLIVDSDSMQVTINGNIVDFAGMFPEFSAGSQQFGYIDDFDGRTIDITLTYHQKYV